MCTGDDGRTRAGLFPWRETNGKMEPGCKTLSNGQSRMCSTAACQEDQDSPRGEDLFDRVDIQEIDFMHRYVDIKIRFRRQGSKSASVKVDQPFTFLPLMAAPWSIHKFFQDYFRGLFWVISKVY